jgi:hypothetical protein
MAASGCKFCDKVGTQPIKTDQTTFNYPCLDVKKKKKNQNTKSSSANGNQVFSSI